MRIGIDIDGVLTDVERFQLDYGSNFFAKYNKFVINPKGYEPYEEFGVNIELEDKFWDEYYFYYLQNYPIRDFSSEIIKKLKDEGNEIYIITARHGEQRISTEEIQSITKNWLEENGVIYDKLIFSPEDKLETCLNNKIDVMVEDKPANINKISTKIPVVCFHSGYNEDCNGDNIHTAYSWYDVYHKIKQLLIQVSTDQK